MEEDAGQINPAPASLPQPLQELEILDAADARARDTEIGEVPTHGLHISAPE